MHHYRINITDLAENDLENIGDYIAFKLKAPETAVSMIHGIRQFVHKLLEHPGRHELERDHVLASYGIRKHYYKNYKISYVIDEKEKVIEILRILHMRVDTRAELFGIFG